RLLGIILGENPAYRRQDVFHGGFLLLLVTHGSTRPSMSPVSSPGLSLSSDPRHLANRQNRSTCPEPPRNGGRGHKSPPPGRDIPRSIDRWHSTADTRPAPRHAAPGPC